MVAKLTQLRHLSWEFADGLTHAGLGQLAGLDLTALHLSDCGLSDEVGDLELKSTPKLVSAAGLRQM